MYKKFKISGYELNVNEQGWGVVVDTYEGRAIELSISAMKEFIRLYEKEFKKGDKTNESTLL